MFELRRDETHFQCKLYFCSPELQTTTCLWASSSTTSRVPGTSIGGANTGRIKVLGRHCLHTTDHLNFTIDPSKYTVRILHSCRSIIKETNEDSGWCVQKNLEITAVDSVSCEGGCLPVSFLKHASSYPALQTAPLNWLPLIPTHGFLCTFCLLSEPCRAVSLSVTTASCCGCDGGWTKAWAEAWAEAWAASHKIKIMSWKTLKGCTGGWLFSVLLFNNCHITEVVYLILRKNTKKQC